MGIKGRRKKKKPLLTKRKIKKRVKFAKSKLKKNYEYIKSIIFSDETKLKLFHSGDGKN